MFNLVQPVFNPNGSARLVYGQILPNMAKNGLFFSLSNVYLTFKRTSLSTGNRDDKKGNRFMSMGMTLWSSRWDHTAGYMAVLPTQMPWFCPEDSSSSVRWAGLVGIDDWSRLMEMASSLPCSRDSRRCWRVDTSRESLLIEPSMLRTGLSV